MLLNLPRNLDRHGRRRRGCGARRAGLALAGGLLSATAAQAQAPVEPTQATVAADTAPANGVIHYPAAFFANFRPTNAFDMVGRVPGFTYAAGDSVRGFAGAAGNVLIDGERPSAKSVSLDDILKRIAPDSVERLDLIRGGDAGIDMQGQPVVVNVVRRSTAASNLTVDGYTRFAIGRAWSETARIEGSRRTRSTTLEGSLFSEIQPGQNESGDGWFSRRDGAGAALATGPLLSRGLTRQYTATAAAEYRREHDTFRMTAGGTHLEVRRNETDDLINNLGAKAPEQVLIDTDRDTAEVGADYQRRLGPNVTARLVGLVSKADNANVSSSRSLSARSTNNRNTSGGERILRGSVTMLRPRGLTVEAGGEAAFNFLQSATRLTANGVPVVLPSANVRVEERRGEAFVTGSLKPTARTSLEAGVRVETSTIGQTGDAQQEKQFTFVKPRLIAAFAPSPSRQVRLRVERVLGQLKFDDFTAVSDFGNGSVSAGNANLQPDRTWLTELTLEQRFWGRGAIVLTGTRREIKGVIDQLAIISSTGAVFSAPGNIGDGWRNDLKLSLTLPTDNLRVPGGQLRLNVTTRNSRVTDPVTGDRRPISLVRRIEGDITYTQNFPQWKSNLVIESGAWGMKDRSYRVGEILTQDDQPRVNVIWNYQPRPDLLLAFAAEGVAGKERTRRRTVFANGTRLSRTVTLMEYRSAEIRPWVSFRIRKTL